jgi:hypothetical protein
LDLYAALVHPVSLLKQVRDGDCVGERVRIVGLFVGFDVIGLLVGIRVGFREGLEVIGEREGDLEVGVRVLRRIVGDDVTAPWLGATTGEAVKLSGGQT